MAAHSESVLVLIDKLCNLYLGETKRSYLIQPKADRQLQLRRMKFKVFDCLFKFLNSPQSKESQVTDCGIRKEVDGVLRYIYNLRLERHFEEADRLEQLVQPFLNENCADGCASVLKLLVKLAGSGTCTVPSTIGQDVYKTLIISRTASQERMLPPGPPCYGDYKHVILSCELSLKPYMHYPPRVFRAQPQEFSSSFTTLESSSSISVRTLTSQSSCSSIFSLTPGSGLRSSHLLSVEREYTDPHEHMSHLSLFGALIQPRDVTLSVRLELPDLPDDPFCSPPEITIPKTLSISELSLDEGFSTREVSSTSTLTTPAASPDVDMGMEVVEDVWDLAMNTTPCCYYTWERIGLEPCKVERPYLTEAGPQAVDHLIRLRRYQEHLMDPTSHLPPSHLLTPTLLVKDIIYLLVGVPSHTFPFVEELHAFTVDPGVALPGLSPEALHSLVGDLVTCGTNTHRLAMFSTPRQLDSFYTGGLVLQAFMGALRSVLHYYVASVNSLPKNLSVLALRLHLGKAIRQMRFLAELCQVGDKPPPAKPEENFPVGVSLISYLYKETLGCVHTDNYLMMLSLLRATCQPFVLFVQDWVFNGTFRDVYGEFMIQVNPTYLESRDEDYWEKGYILVTTNENASVPLFLLDLAPDIFRCGKSLNLLRMCSPDHFLFGVRDSDVPHIDISYSRSYLRDICIQCQMYISRMRQISSQLTLTRAEQKRRREEAKQQLLETARHMAAQEISRLQGVLDERKMKADQLKRHEFSRLKAQLMADQERRAGEVAQAKEEDKEFMAQMMRQVNTLTEEEIELEKQARDQLIAYYAELSEDATKREQRALWRIRRARLETARMQLLFADQEKWKAELAEQREAQKLLQKTAVSASLPEWVQRLESDTGPMPMSGTDGDWSVPRWAQSSTSGTSIVQPTVFVLESSENVSAPSESRLGPSMSVSLMSQETALESEDNVFAASSQTETVSMSDVSTMLHSDSSGIDVSDSVMSTVSPLGRAKIIPSSSCVQSSLIAIRDESELSVANLDRQVTTIPHSAEGFVPEWAKHVVKHDSTFATDSVVMSDKGSKDRANKSDNFACSSDLLSYLDSDFDHCLKASDSSHSMKTVTSGSIGNVSADTYTLLASESTGYNTARSESEITLTAADSFESVGASSSTQTLPGSIFTPHILQPENDRQPENRSLTWNIGIGIAENSVSTLDQALSSVEAKQKDLHPQIQFSRGQHVSTESSGIPDHQLHIRHVPGMSVSSESTDVAPEKLHIKVLTSVNASKETEERAHRPHLKGVVEHGASKETEERAHRPHLKGVAEHGASKETEEKAHRPHLKGVEEHGASKETEEKAHRPHLKGVAEHGASLESTQELQSIPRLAGSAQYNISTETTSQEWLIKKPSLFGHVSQLSKQDNTFQAPRLKRQKFLHANLESGLREFTVRPHIRLSKTRTALSETEELPVRPLVRSVSGQHVSNESEYVDVEELRRKRFLQLNVFGHTSDSTVQQLLYGGQFGLGTSTVKEEYKALIPKFNMSQLDPMLDDLDKYEDHFDQFTATPKVDLLAGLPGVVYWGHGTVTEELTEDDAEAVSFTPLSVILKQALTAPLSAQISLVDSMVVNYFLVELEINTHFEALHRYLFMADGDFAQNLTDILFEKLSLSQLPQEMLTPLFLNSALTRALQLSASADQRYADNLSFALRYMPDFFRHNAHDTLDCLELRYKVSWPVNVVLTDTSQACYTQVFTFMVQLRRIAWTLIDCWYKLKRDAIVKNAKDSPQFRQLQLHRQEMQHFVRVMQGYMANQIIEVTWKEFQEALDSEVHSLDDLKTVHAQYLRKAIFRCLLNKKAAPIMKIIQNIFCLILKFCAQLTSASWSTHPGTREVTHPNFAAMVTSHKAFKEHFMFLFKVVNKLAVRGYQPHLHELLLRLNFNEFYPTK